MLTFLIVAERRKKGISMSLVRARVRDLQEGEATVDQGQVPAVLVWQPRRVQNNVRVAPGGR